MKKRAMLAFILLLNVPLGHATAVCLNPQEKGGLVPFDAVGYYSPPIGKGLQGIADVFDIGCTTNELLEDSAVTRSREIKDPFPPGETIGVSFRGTHSNTNPVPEPCSLLLLGSGMAAAGIILRKHLNAKRPGMNSGYP